MNDLDLKLKSIVEEATKALRANGGKVYLRVPSEQRLKLVASKGIDPEVYPLGSELKVGEGMAGSVIRTKKAMAVSDYRVWHGRIKKLASLFGAVAEVPLLVDKEAIGVLCVFDNRTGRTFSQEILNLCFDLVTGRRQ